MLRRSFFGWVAGLLSALACSRPVVAKPAGFNRDVAKLLRMETVPLYPCGGEGDPIAIDYLLLLAVIQGVSAAEVAIECQRFMSATDSMDFSVDLHSGNGLTDGKPCRFATVRVHEAIVEGASRYVDTRDQDEIARSNEQDDMRSLWRFKAAARKAE